MVGDYIVSVQQAEAAQAAARPVSSPLSNPTPATSCRVRNESGGNYGVYNPVVRRSWCVLVHARDRNGVAASTGRSDLVGLDPAQAAPADQDAMAQALYAQGAAPWAAAADAQVTERGRLLPSGSARGPAGAQRSAGPRRVGVLHGKDAQVCV
jgi:hypothetical protein